MLNRVLSQPGTGRFLGVLEWVLLGFAGGFLTVQLVYGLDTWQLMMSTVGAGLLVNRLEAICKGAGGTRLERRGVWLRSLPVVVLALAVILFANSEGGALMYAAMAVLFLGLAWVFLGTVLESVAG